MSTDLLKDTTMEVPIKEQVQDKKQVKSNVKDKVKSYVKNEISTSTYITILFAFLLYYMGGVKSDLNNRIDKVETKVDTLQKDFYEFKIEINNRFNKIENKINSIDKKLDKLLSR